MSERREKDNYETPAWCVDALLENHPSLGNRSILEPCAGRGAIIEAIRHYCQERGQTLPTFSAVEVREEERQSLKALADWVYVADFLSWKPKGTFDAIITNPPFSIAQQIVERALEIAQGKAEVIMLLKLSFLATFERFPFWQKHPLSKLLVLRDRPSFTGGGSDNSEYAWMCWNSGMGQEIKTIYSPTRPVKRRR